MKTIGSRDKVLKRKIRSDRGKKRKKSKKGIYKSFPKESKKITKKEKLKLFFWQQLPMSREGYKQFPKEVRPSIKKIVYKPFRRIDVKTDLIDSKEKISQFALNEIGQEGVFIMRGFSGGKNRFRVKQVRLAVIKITNHPEGLRAQVYPTFRLSRYKWFYKE